MRTGRPKQPLTLTEEDRPRLESLAHRSRSQPLLARRARVVLACAEGLDNKAAAKKLRCSLGMVCKWRSRFLQAGLEGLYDEPRPGSPRKIDDETDRTDRDSNAGEHAARTDALEHTRTGKRNGIESNDDHGKR